MKILNNVRIWWAEMAEPKWLRLALFLPYGFLLLFVLLGGFADDLRKGILDWVNAF